MTKYLNRLGDFALPHECDFGPYDNTQCACGKSAFVYALGLNFIQRSIEAQILKATPVDTGSARAEWIGRVTEDHGDGTYTIELGVTPDEKTCSFDFSKFDISK